MSVVQDPIFNVFEPPTMVDVGQSYDYDQILESNGNTISATANPSTFQFLTKNANAYYHLHGGYLHVRLNIRTGADHSTAFTAGTLIALANNGYNIFEKAELKLNGKLVEQVDYLGETTLIRLLTELTGDQYASQGGNLGFYKDSGTGAADIVRDDLQNGNYYTLTTAAEGTLKLTVNDGTTGTNITTGTAELVIPAYLKAGAADPTDADDQPYFKVSSSYNSGFHTRMTLTDNGRQLSLWLPLKYMFGFARDYDKVLRGTDIQIDLTKNQESNILFSASGVASGFCYINHVSLWLPIARPSLEAEARINEMLAKGVKQKLFWDQFYTHRDTFSNQTAFTWKITTASRKPKTVIIYMKPDSTSGSQTNNSMIMSNRGATSALLRVNGRQIPDRQYETDFSTSTSYDWARLYAAYMAYCHRQNGEAGIISYSEFSDLYTMWVFDLHASEDGIFDSRNVAELTADFRFNASTSGEIYATVISEREAELEGISGRLLVNI